MRGPAPTPTELKLIRGNPGKRAINKAEPVPASGAPDMPAWLDGEAAREWDRIIAELDGMNLLFRLDAGALAVYCEAWAEFVEALAFIRENGRVCEGKGGQPYQHPMVGIKNKAAERINRMAQQFGFSPAARTRIQMAEQEQADPLEELMARGRSSA